MSGGSRPGGSDEQPPTVERQLPGAATAPETLTRRSGVPAGARRPVAAKRGREPALEQLGERYVGRRPIPALRCVHLRTFALYSAAAMRPSLRVGRAVFAASLALPLLAARPARAQASDPELRPTRGPYITDGARAGDADATAVQLNPGALGFLPAAGLELVAAAADPAVIPRRGFGGYLGLPVPFLRSAFGFGLSRVTDASAVGIDAHTTLQLSYALHFLRGAALGVTWAHIWDGNFAGADTFDLGFSSRVGRYVALGLTVEDVGQPHPNAFGPVLPRLWMAELVLRPLGTSRLEVALGAAHADGDDWDRLVPRARVSVTLTDGLRLYGEGENVPRGTAATFGGGSDTRLAFGLAYDFDHSGTAIGVPILLPGRRLGERRGGGAQPRRERAAPGAGAVHLRRARAAAGPRRRSRLRRPGALDARAGGRSGGGRRAVRDRGAPPRLRAHRGSCATWWRSCARTASGRSPT